jgi:Uma2 family endonuclease
MGIPAFKVDQKFTYADYLNWPNDERWELIHGTAFDMSPAPNTFHQNISGELYRQIANFLKDKPCKVFAAPFDVRLPDYSDEADNEVDNVVQPDISVICDPSKLDERGCKGSPDWIIEILSPHTAKKDMSEKFDLYEKSGVKEYWITDPGSKYVQVYHLAENKKYALSGTYFIKDTVASGVLEGLAIELKDVFTF